MDDVPFQTEAADDSNNDTKTTKSDLGQHDDDKDKITGSIDSKINHDICDDLFDAEMDEDDGGNGKSKENSGIEEADIDNENYVQNAVNDSERGSGHGDNIDDTCNATDNDMFGEGSEDGLGRTKRKKHQDKKEKVIESYETICTVRVLYIFEKIYIVSATALGTMQMQHNHSVTIILFLSQNLANYMYVTVLTLTLEASKEK